MYKLNFKLRILIYIAIAAIIPFTISWYFIYNMVEDKLQQDLFEIRSEDVQNQVSKINEVFKQQENILLSIAKSYSLLPDEESTISSFLNQQTQIEHHFNNLYIVKHDGTVFLGKEDAAAASSSLPAFGSLVNAKKPVQLTWLEPFTDVVSNKKCIGIALSLKSSQGKNDGVLVGSIPLEIFDNMLSIDKYIKDMNTILLSSSGAVKYDSNNEYDESITINDDKFILSSLDKTVMNLKAGKKHIKFNGKDWFCIFSTISSNGWKVVVLLDTEKFISEVDSVNKDIYNYIIIFGFIAIFLVKILAVILSNSISKPLLTLRDAARKLAMGNLEHKISIQGKNEINDVANSINEMSSNLEKTYSELFNRTVELFNNNKHLQEINAELEASYQQLGAAMTQLNESEEKYRKLVNNISDMVFVINEDNIIVYINSKVEQVLGYSESELIGKSIGMLIKKEEKAASLLNAWEDNFIEYQLEMIKSDGSIITVEGSARRIIEEGKITGVQAISRDVTQRKLMEFQLEKRYNELQVLNKVSNAIANTLDLNKLLHTIVNQVIEVSDALVCSIRLIDNQKQYDLVLKAIQGVGVSTADVEDLAVSSQLTIEIINKKKNITIELQEEQLQNQYMRELYTEEGARYVTFNPLITQGAAIGVMSTTTKVMPSLDQLELISSLANSVAIAIDNVKAYENLKQAYVKTVQSLVSAVEAKDLYTESHSIRVAKYACFIASEMGYSKEFIGEIWVAGVLHDIGKIGISDLILNKKDKLTHEEYEIIKNHPNISYKILSKIGLSDDIMNAVKHHHERYDGRGYPDKLMGANTSIMAAIISIADAFDAITSERSYKKARSIRQGIDEIAANRGTQFDPKIVDIFERAFLMKSDIIEKIYNNEEIDFF